MSSPAPSPAPARRVFSPNPSCVNLCMQAQACDSLTSNSQPSLTDLQSCIVQCMDNPAMGPARLAVGPYYPNVTPTAQYCNQYFYSQINQ